MLKIRLTRTGRKNQPLYRVVLAEHARPVKGKFIEVLGVYDPCGKQGEPKLEAERIKYWIGQGVQVSPRVASILQKAGVVKGDETTVAQALKKLAQKKAAMRKPKKEEEESEEGGGKEGATPVESKAEVKPEDVSEESEEEKKEEAQPKEKKEELKAEKKDEKKDEPKPEPVGEKKSEPAEDKKKETE
ncbi:30S ribosomal protein S16 [Patescibacteria group bacterium]|nr:30S ribosomal protein S16 [Patescibacteria group bacterium]